MLRNHAIYKPFSEKPRHQFLELENSLELENLTFIWDQNKKQLILIMDVNRLTNKEIKAALIGNRLILEAPLISYYNKPIRTHHLGQENRDEFEEGLTFIGFSEVKLKYGYKYSLISCQELNPKMIKVVLRFSSWGRNWDN